MPRLGVEFISMLFKKDLLLSTVWALQVCIGTLLIMIQFLDECFMEFHNMVSLDKRESISGLAAVGQSKYLE